MGAAPESAGETTDRGAGIAALDANDPRLMQLVLIAVAHMALVGRGGRAVIDFDRIPDQMAFDLKVEGMRITLSLKPQERKIELVTASAGALNDLLPASQLIGKAH